MNNNTKFCKFCGEEIEKGALVCPKCGRQVKLLNNKISNEESINDTEQYDEKSKFYSKTWFMWLMLIVFAPIGIILMWKFHGEMKKKAKIILTIVFLILFLLIAIGASGDSTNSESINGKSEEQELQVEIIDFSEMQEHEILAWCKDNNVNCDFKREYSDTIPKDEFISQSVAPAEKISGGGKFIVIYSLGKEPTTEQRNALKKAELYASTMYMSKQSIYDQLVSPYGENFDKEAAQYAIDNIEWDWCANALEKAKIYRDTMSMSKNSIYDQLISPYGENFTKEEAQYAIDNLDD